MSRKCIKSKPGLFGTVYYYDESGNYIGKSRPGLVEDTRVYSDSNGNYAGKSRKGYFSKRVFTDTNHEHITSYDSFLGEVHFKDGSRIGQTRPSFFGVSYTSLEAEDEILEENSCYGDMSEENLSVDPAKKDCEEYIPKSKYPTLLLVLQSIALFLVLCMIIASLYAIIML